MSYYLNSVNLTSYGIIASHAPGSNICLQGCFDLPTRMGKSYHNWGDEDSVEPYVLVDELMFNGRDITFHGLIRGTYSEITAKLTTFYNALDLFTDPVLFATDYGNFNVLVKGVTPEFYRTISKVAIHFREPVVDLTIGGLIPDPGTSINTIDNIPLESYNLYYTKGYDLNDLPETKEQFFIKYASEGWQVTKRKNNTFDFNGFIVADNLSDFILRVQTLYQLFAVSGLRNIKLNNQIYLNCFLTEGFKVEKVLYRKELVIANFSANFICVNTRTILQLLEKETGEAILTEAGENIYV
jgi:hypothetical protein